jgi:hypothetical protein
MPGKMDPMQARALASRMRRQYPRATTGQLKGMIDGTGNPMGEDPMKLRGMSPRGYQGPETGPAYRPISELSEMELNQLGITRKDPVESLRRMESSAAYGESDPMTGMTETEAFPVSFDPPKSMPFNRGRQFDRMMDTADMPAMARGDFMDDLVSSRDYGNAYADIIANRPPDSFKSVDELADVPGQYEMAIEKAFDMYNRLGEIPVGITVEIGRLAGLMDVKRAMDDMDAESLRRSMAQDRNQVLKGREVQPAIESLGDYDDR